MKKFSVIFMVVMVFLLVSFANGQDCGKCPLKCKAAKKQQTVQEKKISDPVVYVGKSDKQYHRKGCKLIKNQTDYTEVVLSKALEAGAKPCTECNLQKKITPSQKNSKEEKKNK